jgi:hypothetical protein
MELEELEETFRRGQHGDEGFEVFQRRLVLFHGANVADVELRELRQKVADVLHLKQLQFLHTCIEDDRKRPIRRE